MSEVHKYGFTIDSCVSESLCWKLRFEVNIYYSAKSKKNS